MTRILFAGTALLVMFAGVGCCYHPGCVNPYTGTPYGGHWEPVCGGPCDPLGWGCGWWGWWGCGCGRPYAAPGYGYGGYADPCCPSTCGDGCNGCETAPMMVPRTFQGEVQPAPGVTNPPVPDPNMSLQQSSGGSTTFVAPRQRRRFGRGPVRHASNLPAVSAF